MDIVMLKFLILGGIFVLTCVSSLVPQIFISSLRTTIDPDKKTIYTRVIGLLNCFAAGVFLSTALLELLPEVSSSLEKVLHYTLFPVAEFSIAFGFLLVLIIENIAIACNEEGMDTLSTIERLNVRTSDLEREVLQDDDPMIQRIPNLPELVEQKPVPSLRALFLLLALSIHSIFEGLAVGLESDFHSTLRVFFAVLIHKTVIGFSIGLNLLQSEMKLLTVILLSVIFALTTPLGIVFGIYLDNFYHDEQMLVLNGILQGIACGTFLYVTCFEVLPKELDKGRDRLLKILSILIGFSLMCGAIFMHCHSEC
uniref:Uncharacterized protein n=2 Tax=Clastoptera arizonana TaxID=38151 RepID=A0A1B6CCS2_9HEMI